MKVRFLNQEIEGQHTEKLKSTLAGLMNAEVKVIYQTKTGGPTEQTVEGKWLFKNLINKHGLSGPGKGDPEIVFNVKGEDELSTLEIEDLDQEKLEEKMKEFSKQLDRPLETGKPTEDIIKEELDFEALTEINGVGEKTKEKIKSKLLGSEEEGEDQDAS